MSRPIGATAKIGTNDPNTALTPLPRFALTERIKLATGREHRRADRNQHAAAGGAGARTRERSRGAGGTANVPAVPPADLTADQLAALLAERAPRLGRTRLIALDGRSGAGKTWLGGGGGAPPPGPAAPTAAP